MHEIWTRIEHRLDRAEVRRTAAFDHVARERPRTARKTDQRHALTPLRVGERGANFAHGVGHVAQRGVDIRHREARDVVFRAYRTNEFRAFAGHELEAETHGVGHGQDVGEQDRSVERITLERLQRDFRCERRALRQTEETARATTRGVVFRQVAASLPHQPDRRVVGGLAQQRAQKSVVQECMGHVAYDSGQKGILPDPARRIALDASNSCCAVRPRPVSVCQQRCHDLAKRPMFKHQLPGYYPTALSDN
jgi:hypothetical protein